MVNISAKKLFSTKLQSGTPKFKYSLCNISRTATCTSIGLVRCLTLDRDAFVTLIGTTAERNYDDDHKLSISSNSSAECLTPLTPTGAMMIQSLPSFSDVRLNDLKVLQKDQIKNYTPNFLAPWNSRRWWIRSS